MDSKDERLPSPLVITHKRKSGCNGEITEEPLSPAARMYHEPRSECCIVVTMGFEQKIDVNRVKARLEDTLLHHPRFSSILTINDVLVGVTSAGLSRYLGRNYGEKKSGIHIRAVMAVNTRPVPGIQDLAKMMEGDSGGARWGNSVGFIFLPLPLDMQDDPLDYIQKSKAITERKKNSFEAIFTESLIYLGLKMFGRKVTTFLVLKVFQRATLFFSNNIGPVEGIEFCGNPIVYLATGVFGIPHAITLHFQSYMNKMEIVVAVDEPVVPDPHELLGDIADSLKLIKDAAVSDF